MPPTWSGNPRSDEPEIHITMSSFAVGSLVSARGREWVVLPDSTEELLMLRPLGGTDDEVTGILSALEPVTSAQFSLPDPQSVGDYRSSRMLRDAVRLGFRASAGPFRSFGRLAVEPRPYQLAPLLVALRIDPVRLLIADDVGIGKTVEACLIVRELIDRGEVTRFVVLSPPHLAEQWQTELADKFLIDAEILLPSTVRRLESRCAMGESIFQRFPYLVVSIDFIKSDRHRPEFLRNCPPLVIVDEAHGCAYSAEQPRGRHQRHRLVTEIADDSSRHLVLVTATPHSGKEEAFRSLLTLLKPEFAKLPVDLAGRENERHRRHLARHFVQRRRADIRHYLHANTPFPEREESELSYRLAPEYRHFLERVLAYARETVAIRGEDRRRQRVRWWSALALLRSLASSPEAAAATLRNRASTAGAETPEGVDDLGRRAVMDWVDDEAEEAPDLVSGADPGDEDEQAKRERRRLQQMAREAEALAGLKDEKLKRAMAAVKKLVKDGFHPIVFCRFIPTAEYVAAALRDALGQHAEVAAVTGNLPPSDREQRVLELGEAGRRVLVATDCLSEGINLQDHFNAVLHYDLSWSPTRHEQREGRVDRYGQPSPKVRVVTYYGTDNQIDGVVLEVLLRKHKTIRSSLGVSVPVPVDSEKVMEAVFEGLLLRGGSGNEQYHLPGFEPVRDELFSEWEKASEREKRSRTMFAQESIKVQEVAAELDAARSAVGSGADVAWFVREALAANGALLSGDDPLAVNLAEASRSLRDLLPVEETFKARFELPVDDQQIYLHRSHPIVESLSAHTMDAALDPEGRSAASRCGAVRSLKVARRTTLLLLRARFHLITTVGRVERTLMAEDVLTLAFEGAPDRAVWLTTEEANALLSVAPDQNIDREQAADFIRRVITDFEGLRPALEEAVQRHADELLDAHQRVRHAIRTTGRTRVEPVLPPDVLGVYVYLPAASAGA